MIHRLLPPYALIVFAVASPAWAQRAPEPPQRLTTTDYARAEQFMPYNTAALVLHALLRPTWLSDDRLWYLVRTGNGIESVLFDPATRARARCDLPACKTAETQLSGSSGPRTRPRAESLSPDGKRTAFLRDWNLWLRDVATNRETPLTTDGIENYGYATDNAGWSRSDRPIVLWSPDSKKLATFKQDQRTTGEMYLVDTRVGHPRLRAWKYPLPGDDTVTTIERVVIDVDRPRVIRFQMPPDQHRSSACDNLTCRAAPGRMVDVQWTPDSLHVAFLSTSRDHKREQLRLADAETGAVRTVLEESVTTFFEAGTDRANWRYLPLSNEVIWFSERDNWGQLYLYNANTGALKHAITTGEGNVTDVLRVDEKNRLVYFVGVGREKGRDPYYAHLYRSGFDDRSAQLLTPENATHDIAISPSGKFLLDTFSTPDMAPVSVVRDADGREIVTLERADVSKLKATGWMPPVSFTVKARDGTTDLYGLLYKPTTLDATKKYPIINHIYPGPQRGSVGTRTFSASRGDAQALAELGFVVVEIDGLGTALRSKQFHEFTYGKMGDNTLPDQVMGMQQLAARFPWIDLDRAGVYGHSGGGYAAAGAMFRYPDFFKVGISEAGNHDNRSYEDDWGEKWQGLLQKTPEGADNYNDQANENVAKNLKGKLLLAHGTMDDNVPPTNTLLVVDALIKANKDFDLLMLPNRDHNFGDDSYMVRRRWDYFVKYLLGAEPPHEYPMRQR